MNTSGLILREDVLEVPLVESMYGSSRNFLYQMNKLGDEVNREEQKNEKSTSPIVTLELIESGASADGMAQQFGNVKYNPHSITDTELCGLIDNDYLRRCSCADVIYDATLSERAYMYECISRDLWPMMHKSTSDAQLRRCLILGRER